MSIDIVNDRTCEVRSNSDVKDKNPLIGIFESGMNFFRSIGLASSQPAHSTLIHRNLSYQTTSLHTEPLPQQTGNDPIFTPEDGLFRNSYGQHLLKVYGPSITVDEAEETALRVLNEYGLNKEQIHGSQLFHGSTASSLIAFTDYNQSQGALIPLGTLEEQGKVPFCGEIVDGRDKVNAQSLSTTWIGELEGAIRYSYRRGDWNPDIGNQKIKAAIELICKEDFESDEAIDAIDPTILPLCKEALNEALITGDFSKFKIHYNSYVRIVRTNFDWPESGTNVIRAINSIEINQKRIAEWEKLTEEERELVSKPFPVLYGIKSQRQKVHHKVWGIEGEIGLRGGAQPGEIKVIFVPPEKIAFVKSLLEKHHHPDIAVEALPPKK